MESKGSIIFDVVIDSLILALVVLMWVLMPGPVEVGGLLFIAFCLLNMVVLFVGAGLLLWDIQRLRNHS